MKTIEQKARAYDEALERARKWHNDSHITIGLKGNLEDIFPELKEEQRTDDETLRKNLIKAFNTVGGKHWGGLEVREILTWLEKQSTDISSFPKEQQVFLKKYTSFDKITLIKLLAERDANNTEIIKSFEKQGEPNPYSGVSFSYNGSIWGMCARDGGVEISMDGKLKAFISSDKSLVYPTNPIPNIKPKSALEAVREEKVDNQNCIKPDDKVDPKFSEGEWITDSECEYTWKIIDVKPLDYILQSQSGNIVDDMISYVDEHFHSFTVKDAKEGDVLVAGNVIFIFNKIHGIWINCHCSLHKDGSFYSEDYDLMHIKYSKEVYPATKEQRTSLLKAMDEAGYTFDFDSDKKELKKIEQKPYYKLVKPSDQYEGLTDFERTLADICKGWIGKDIEWEEYIKDNADVLLKIAAKKFNSVQDVPLSPAWGEEDTFMYNKIKNLLTDISLAPESRNSLFDWLKSLKDRVQPQPKQEWRG